MDSSPSGFTLSSGRRPPPVRSGCLVAAGVLAIVAVLVVLEVGDREQRNPTVVEATTPTPEPPQQQQQPIATPTRLVELASEWVVAATEVTPTPWAPAPPAPPRRREPTPTPSAAACISASYDAQQSLAAWGNVLISIRATNRCRRVLQPTDVLFRVSGYRDGAVVQTAQGSPFEEIYPGRSTDFGIGLPGSIDWYDRITVEVLD
jgi:hypothetical protein